MLLPKDFHYFQLGSCWCMYLLSRLISLWKISYNVRDALRGFPAQWTSHGFDYCADVLLVADPIAVFHVAKGSLSDLLYHRVIYMYKRFDYHQRHLNSSLVCRGGFTWSLLNGGDFLSIAHIVRRAESNFRVLFPIIPFKNTILRYFITLSWPRGAEAMPIHYTESFKMDTIRRLESGETIKELSRELRISQSSIYRWRKDYRTIQAPSCTYTPAEFDAISRRLRKAEHELEIIRSSGYIDEVPLQKKLSVLEDLYHQADAPYSIHELCDALGVARGTFYNHIFRRADRSKYEGEQLELMIKIQQIFDDSGQRYGAEKIRVILAESGIRTSAKRVSAIMQELGLKGIRYPKIAVRILLRQHSEGRSRIEASRKA